MNFTTGESVGEIKVSIEYSLCGFRPGYYNDHTLSTCHCRNVSYTLVSHSLAIVNDSSQFATGVCCWLVTSKGLQMTLVLNKYGANNASNPCCEQIMLLLVDSHDHCV